MLVGEGAEGFGALVVEMFRSVVVDGGGEAVDSGVEGGGGESRASTRAKAVAF